MYNEKFTVEVRRKVFRDRADVTPDEDRDMCGFPIAKPWKDCPVIVTITLRHADSGIPGIAEGFHIESLVAHKALGVADYHQVAHALTTMGVKPLDPSEMEERLGKEKFPSRLWDVSDYW